MSIMKVQRVRDAVTKTAKLLARDKVEIRQRGLQPHVQYRPDGSVEYVNLPVIPDAPSQEFLDAMQGFLDHEVAHVLFTDNKAEIEVLTRAVSEGADPVKVKSFSNAFEDVRIEARMRAEYQGSGYNLSKSLDFVLSKKVQPLLDQANRLKGPERIPARVLASFVAWVRMKGGDENAKRWLEERELLADYLPMDLAMPDLADRLKALKSSADAATLAHDFLKAITPPPPPPTESESESDDEDEGGEGEKSDKPKLGDAKGGTAEDDDTKGDDQEDDEGEGAGGSDEESESDTHKADEDADSDGDGEGSDDGEDGEKPEPGEDDEDGAEEEGDDEEGGERETNIRLTQAMKRLEPTQRKLLSDYNRKKKTVSQIASEAGSDPFTVANDLRTARTRLVSILEGGR